MTDQSFEIIERILQDGSRDERRALQELRMLRASEKALDQFLGCYYKAIETGFKAEAKIKQLNNYNSG